jgi:hypothetical protein
VDCGGAAKPGPVEILQHGPTGRRTLENADHKNVVIAILPPKSHSQRYRIYRLGNIDAVVQLWLQQTAQPMTRRAPSLKFKPVRVLEIVLE